MITTPCDTGCREEQNMTIELERALEDMTDAERFALLPFETQAKLYREWCAENVSDTNLLAVYVVSSSKWAEEEVKLRLSLKRSWQTFMDERLEKYADVIERAFVDAGK